MPVNHRCEIAHTAVQREQRETGANTGEHIVSSSPPLECKILCIIAIASLNAFSNIDRKR